MLPKYIVLDEPTAMLDPFGRQEVMRTIQMLNQEYHMTVILITHYMDEAAKAQRVIVMDHGNVVKDASPREVFSDVEGIRALGLDVPQATELMYELQKAGVPVQSDILETDECIEALLKVI